MAKFELTAEIRHEFGKGASRRQRRLEDKIPAIMYGGGEPALPLTFQQRELRKALENEAFYSHILTIHIDGKKHQAVLKDLQRHPYKSLVQHIDLLRITGKEKIQMSVPLHFKGDDVAPGVKVGNGVVSHLISTVEVRCLPANLPEYIEVDLSKLELDETIHLSHLKLGEGVELVDLLHGNDRSVANIHIPRAIVEEETTAAPVAAEVPATAQKAPEEGKADAKAAADKGKGAEKGKEKK
jgi:large subunit ribosomal protein L25